MAESDTLGPVVLMLRGFGVTQKQSMYRPLPPAGVSGGPLRHADPATASPAPAPRPGDLPDFIVRMLPAPLVRLRLWFLSTGEPSDSPLGRFADTVESLPWRYGLHFAVAGVLIGCIAAFVFWFTGKLPHGKSVPGLFAGTAFAGVWFGFLLPLMFFTLLAWVVRYWRWVLGYAVLLAAAAGIADLRDAS